MFLRRYHGDRRRFVGGRRRLRALARSGQPRAHDLLLDLGGSADRAGDERALGLLVVGGGILEPAFEGMAFGADQRITDHRGSPSARKASGSAIGSIISNRRPCWSEGTRPRAAATAAGSICASTMPGSTSPSAR